MAYGGYAHPGNDIESVFDKTTPSYEFAEKEVCV